MRLKELENSPKLFQHEIKKSEKSNNSVQINCKQSSSSSEYESVRVGPR
jgi:hypothetical protein